MIQYWALMLKSDFLPFLAIIGAKQYLYRILQKISKYTYYAIIVETPEEQRWKENKRIIIK